MMTNCSHIVTCLFIIERILKRDKENDEESHFSF